MHHGKAFVQTVQGFWKPNTESKLAQVLLSPQKKLKYKSYTKPAWPSKTFVEHSHKHNYKEIKWTKILHKDFFAQKNHKEEKGFMLALLKSASLFILNFPAKILVKI